MNSELSSILKDIVSNPLFWTALVALVNALQKWLLPQVPDGVVLAFNAFVLVIAGTLTGQQARVAHTDRGIAAIASAAADK